MIKKAAIVFLLLTSLITTSLAQVGKKGLNADGKDFYLGWLYPSYNDQNLNLGGRDPKPFFGVYVLVSSYTDNQFSVSYFDDKTGKDVNASSFQIAKHRALIVPVDRTKMRMDAGGPNGFDGEVAQWRAMHITSEKPINVQFFSSGANSGGSYLGLPVTALGKEYVVEAYKDNPSGSGGYLSSENSSGYFMVIAAFDGTTVNIVPNSTTKVAKQAGVNCGPGATGAPQGFTISLQRGQCYMVKSQGVDSYCDMSGSTVVADKPIAVIGGHENAYTDGSSIGTVLVEARDYMIEQMLPVEYWDSTGYISVPMVDSKAAQGGDGDNVAFFYGKLTNAPTNYPQSTTVKLQEGSQVHSYKISAYPSAVAAKVGETAVTSASDTNGAKMHMVQYDQRMQGLSPFPAPSQLTIIPKSCWKTSYLWYIPANVTPQEVYQGYYITLICDKDDYNNGTLQWAQDGGILTSIKTSGQLVGGINSVPGYPNLIAMTIKLSAPRAYYAKSTIGIPFVIYNYGFRGIDVDRDLGDFCSDDHFFAYANPVGTGIATWDSSFFKVTVDSLCAMWDICAQVSGTNEPKIKAMTLLNDPDQDFVNRPNSSVGYQSYNVRFDLSVDPDATGEVHFSAENASQCIRLYVTNPFDSAIASIMILDNNGNYTIKTFNYKNQKIHISSTPAKFLEQPNKTLFPTVVIGDTQCIQITYRNYGTVANKDSSYYIRGMGLTRGNTGFTISSTTPTLPTLLKPGDSLTIQLCFQSRDTLEHLDTMIFSTECFGAPVYLKGHNGTGLIAASDFEFGEGVLHQAQYRGTIVLRNLGNTPFTIGKKYLFSDTTNFSIESSSIGRLPYMLYPADDSTHPNKDTMQVWVEFHPKQKLGIYSDTVKWSTDLRTPFQNQIKSWSSLSGIGVKLGVFWDRAVQRDTTFKDRPIVRRVNLFSRAISQASIDKVYFAGTDTAEYSVSADQIKLLPLQNFLIYPKDTIWVQYTFTPNLSKPESQKYIDRHVDLVVTYFLDGSHTLRDSEVIHFIGVVDSLTSEVKTVTENKPTKNTSIVKAYVQNNQIVVSIDEAGTFDCTLFDLLGRKVSGWAKVNSKRLESEEFGITLALDKISSGAYVIRLQSADGGQYDAVVMVQ